jgi:hypothetical protein
MGPKRAGKKKALRRPLCGGAPNKSQFLWVQSNIFIIHTAASIYKSADKAAAIRMHKLSFVKNSKKCVVSLTAFPK